jgi:hypothetical protein
MFSFSSTIFFLTVIFCLLSFSFRRLTTSLIKSEEETASNLGRFILSNFDRNLQTRGVLYCDFPNTPFEYYFLDQQFDKAYKNDKQFGIFFRIFATLAKFIACLGLFGMSSFIAYKKPKK